MAAPVGNEFWKLRSKHGRDTLFASPDALWDAAVEYFEWCVNNPLKEDSAFHFQGTITHAALDKMRPFTMKGLCLYLGCSDSYFREFKTNCTQDFLTVVTRIEDTVYVQKFEGASAGLLNPNIIARDLGLADKKEIDGGLSISWNEEKTYEANDKTD